MICVQCGQVVNDGTKFCRFCGAPLNGEVQATPVQPAQQPVQYQIPVNSAVPAYAGYVQPAAVKKPKSKFSLKNPGTILTLLGCVLIILACILPVEYAELKILHINETRTLLRDTYAWFLHFLAVALILSFLFTNLKIGVFVTSFIEALICGLDLISMYFDVERNQPLVHFGSGYYLLIAGMIVIFAGGVWLFFSRMRKGS